MHNTSSFIHTKLMMSSCHTHKILTLSLQTRRTCSLPYTHTSTLNWYPLVNTHLSHTSTCALTQTHEHQHIHFNTLTWTHVNTLQTKRIRTHTHTHISAHPHTSTQIHTTHSSYILFYFTYTPHIKHTHQHTLQHTANSPDTLQCRVIRVVLFSLNMHTWNVLFLKHAHMNTHTHRPGPVP